LPAPNRISKRRTYTSAVMGRIRIIQVARDAGFSIAETRTFLSNLPNGSTPSGRWQKLAQQKLQEMDALIVRANQMKAILRSSFKCGCKTIADCERLMLSSAAS
jgi:MerR family transcriptional regulator, redox-sensitive transcriptional activator SoxR